MLADDTLVDERPAPTAIVTGGAGGIGKAVCEALARDGFIVVVADRDELGARAVADACGGFAVGVDVADEASVVAAFGRAHDVLGRLDALVTAAGIAAVAPFMDHSAASFRAIGDVNVLGTYLCIREAAKRMTSGGRICTIASIAGLLAVPSAVAYAASKAAVISLTRSAASWLGRDGIAVNGVAPGFVMTPMVDAALSEADRERVAARTIVQRLADPDEIAEAIAWLVSQRASYVHGSILGIDGGLSLA